MANVTFTVQSGRAFKAGQWVLAQSQSVPTAQILGQVVSYSGTTLVINPITTGGSGTHNDWIIVLTNSAAAVGYQPPLGIGNVTGPPSSTAGHVATYADTTGRILQDGGVLTPGAGTITPSMFGNSATAFGGGAINAALIASVAGNALTIAVKTLAGADPSSSDPVIVPMRDPGFGDYLSFLVTSALSITVPSGATLGTVNGQANRIWIGLFYNAGTPVLGVYNSLSGTSLLPWDETSTANGTGITSSSTAAQTWYTANTLSAKPFRILGYAESNQATAGTWASSVTAKLFGPGVKKAGDVFGTVFTSTGSNTNTTSTSFVNTANAATINVSSAANLVSIQTNGGIQQLTANDGAQIQIVRGATGLTPQNGVQNNANGATQCNSCPLNAMDVPGAAGSTTYTVQLKAVTGGTANYPCPTGIFTGTMRLDEIQI